MSKIIAFLIFLSISVSASAQIINGIVYDTEARVNNIKVLNISKKTLTTTNDKGEFSLKAQVNDTLSFQSIFYKPIMVIVKKDYFNSTYVFEIEKLINELETVSVKSKPKELLFGENAFNANLKKIIVNDKKKDELLTYNDAPKYGVDFIRVAKMIGKLFKKKRKPIPNTLKYSQFELLFAENNFFTKKMLTNDLNIPEKYQYLFYDFLEAKEIPESKLNYNKRLLLLDDFTMHAQEFLIIIEMAEEQTSAKD